MEKDEFKELHDLVGRMKCYPRQTAETEEDRKIASPGRELHKPHHQAGLEVDSPLKQRRKARN